MPETRRCVIVCPGPSAALFKPEDWGGWHVCAVNRASVLLDDLGAEYQWYGAQDGISLQIFNPSPSVGIIQSRKMLDQFKDRWPKYSDDYEVYDPKDARWEIWTGYTCWSATCAIACLIRMGYNELVAYGIDWSGTEDWDGPAASQRSDHRWRNESDIITRILRGNPQASFRRITMSEETRDELIAQAKELGVIKRKDTKLSDEELRDAISAAEAVTVQTEPEPAEEAPAFKPYTFDDLAKNNIGRCLRMTTIRRIDSEAGAVIEKGVTTLAEVANLEKYPAPNGKEQDRPFNNFARFLGSRGRGSLQRTGAARAHAVIEQAREMLAANERNGA